MRSTTLVLWLMIFLVFVPIAAVHVGARLMLWAGQSDAAAAR
jgi:hypothetical protein